MVDLTKFCSCLELGNSSFGIRLSRKHTTRQGFFTAQKMKFFVMDFLSKCDQIRSTKEIVNSFFVQCLGVILIQLR